MGRNRWGLAPLNGSGRTTALDTTPTLSSRTDNAARLRATYPQAGGIVRDDFVVLGPEINPIVTDYPDGQQKETDYFLPVFSPVGRWRGRR